MPNTVKGVEIDPFREKLIELCEDVILSCKASLCADCEHNCIDYPNCMGVHFADHLIANGVTIPVRCKECKYWENGKDYESYCNHWASMLAESQADDFCSYGERKT